MKKIEEAKKPLFIKLKSQCPNCFSKNSLFKENIKNGMITCQNCNYQKWEK